MKITWFEGFNKQLGLLFFAVFIDLFGFGVIIPIIPILARKELGASGFEYGIIISIYSLMQFIFAPIWGSISDSKGRRPVILIGLGGSSIGFAIFGFANSLIMIYVARAMAGIFTAATLSVSYAYIGDTTPPEKRGSAYGLITAAFGLGFAIGPAIGGFLSKVPFFGFPSHMLPAVFSALLAIINLISAYSYLPESLPTNPEKLNRLINQKDGRPLFSLTTFRQVTSMDGIRSYILTFSLITFGFSMWIAAFSVYAPEVDVSVDELKLGIYFTYAGFLLVVTQFVLIKPMYKKFSEKSIIKIGILAMLIGFIALPFAPSYAWMFVANTPLILGIGLTSPSINSAVSKLADKKDLGLVMGFNQSGASLMRVIGPLIAGGLFDVSIKFPFYLGSAIFTVIIIFTSKLIDADTKLI